jgi:hypothetical protein
MSGNTQQGLNTFAQNYASNAYQNAFNNYNTNQTNIFNRLASIAGIGQTGVAQNSTSGQNAVNASTNLLTSGAAAQAAGQVGSANALTGGLNNAAAWNYLGNNQSSAASAYVDPFAATGGYNTGVLSPVQTGSAANYFSSPSS